MGFARVTDWTPSRKQARENRLRMTGHTFARRTRYSKKVSDTPCMSPADLLDYTLRGSAPGRIGTLTTKGTPTMSAFNRTPRYSNPLATADATRMTAHNITVESGKFYGGNRDAGVMPRFVTRFRDADGTRYLHVGSPRYFDLEGKPVRKADAALVCGSASITDGATLELVSNGIVVSGTDASVGHIVKLRA